MMLDRGARTGHRRRWRNRMARAPWFAPAVAVLAMAAGGLSGCAAHASAGPAIRISAAYVPVPHAGRTVAYVVIRNNGGADRLLSARTSVGGRVVFHAPDAPGVVSMHTVQAIPIPAHAVLAMDPNGFYMMITGAGPMQGGKDITLTLVFARAGPITAIAQVTNPATGGSSYFLN